MPTRNTSVTSLLRFGVFTTDNWHHWREYDLPDPIFAPAIGALFEGFALLPQEFEVHIIRATQKLLQHVDRLGPSVGITLWSSPSGAGYGGLRWVYFGRWFESPCLPARSSPRAGNRAPLGPRGGFSRPSKYFNHSRQHG